MIIPNAGRVLIKRIGTENFNTPIIAPGQLKAGENLYYGEIVHAGDTTFTKGQHVYYSEFSAAAIQQLGDVETGKKTLGEAMSSGNVLFVVANDDIMAMEVNDDTKEIRDTTTENKS